MLHTWESKATAGCLLCTALLAPAVRGYVRELQHQHQAEQAVQQEVTTVLAALTALRAHPVQRLRPLALAVQEITDVVTALHHHGLHVTLTTTAPRALTLAQHTVTAVPCQLVIRSADFGPMLHAVQAIERGQVIETEWRIDAHGTVLQFHILGDPEPPEARGKR